MTSGSSGTVDHLHRRTDVTEASGSSGEHLRERLQRIMPALAAHFDVELTGFEDPQVLRYLVGHFRRTHEDGRFLDHRKVSVTVSLNDPFGGIGPDLTDGDLVLYDLFPGDRGQHMGFPLAANAGLLVAFGSLTRHQVTEVTSGCRYSVVAWYY